MQVFTLITADILFLLLIVVGVVLERRLSRLEFERMETENREESAYFDLAFELDALRKRLDGMTPPEPDEDEKSREQAAEKLFTEGVASIFGYDFRGSVGPQGRAEPDNTPET